MSQLLRPLSVSQFSASVCSLMPKLSEQVRLRIREEMERKDMSQRDVAGILDWSQSRVAHLLTGRVEMCVDDVQGFAFALGFLPTELVRDRGLEFCAEMTPTEFRLFERIRQLTPDQRQALMTIVNVTLVEPRRATAKAKLSRGRG